MSLKIECDRCHAQVPFTAPPLTNLQYHDRGYLPADWMTLSLGSWQGQTMRVGPMDLCGSCLEDVAAFAEQTATR